jgi:hypothetical protein
MMHLSATTARLKQAQGLREKIGREYTECNVIQKNCYYLLHGGHFKHLDCSKMLILLVLTYVQRPAGEKIVISPSCCCRCMRLT